MIAKLQFFFLLINQNIYKSSKEVFIKKEKSTNGKINEKNYVKGYLALLIQLQFQYIYFAYLETLYS